jgi:hypothetical protein
MLFHRSPLLLLPMQVSPHKARPPKHPQVEPLLELARAESIGDNLGASGVNAIEGRMSYSIAANVAPTNSNGQAIWTRTSLWNFSGPYSNVYMYTDSTNVAVHVAIEVAAGIYSHFSFGSIIKTDTFTGGEYISGNYAEYKPGTPDYLYIEFTTNSTLFPGQIFNGGGAGNYFTYMRSVPLSGSTGDEYDFLPACAQAGSGSTARLCTFGGINGWSGLLLRDCPNTGTLRSPMFPYYVSRLDTVSENMAIAGYVPGARIIAVDAIDAAEIVLTNWQCFPYSQKTARDVNYNVACPGSKGFGVAFYRA